MQSQSQFLSRNSSKQSLRTTHEDSKMHINPTSSQEKLLNCSSKESLRKNRSFDKSPLQKGERGNVDKTKKKKSFENSGREV